jgi:putative transposase
MRYAFNKGYYQQFNVRWMCDMLTFHPSEFNTWLKEAREESGKVYGCRKLHDVLQDQGEACCPNRVVRLTRMAGIKAQIGYNVILALTVASLQLL